MVLQVRPFSGTLAGAVHVPSSKPETQRALLTATLAEGASVIQNDLRCAETSIVKAACRALGAEISEAPHQLEVVGAGARLRAPGHVLDCVGSGFALRTVLALASGLERPVILTGDGILRSRVLEPLVEALRQAGARVDYVSELGKAPVVNWGEEMYGGRCTLPGDVSSQFVTAMLLAAPRAKHALEIRVDGKLYSSSYVRQTIEAMRRAGVQVEASETMDRMAVHPQTYRPFGARLSGDYTSASYLFALAALFPGTVHISNLARESAQGERLILDVIEELGLDVGFDGDRCTIHNRTGGLRGSYEFDVSNAPNIVPTLAAIGAFVEGRFRVVGGSITNYHKSPRILAMVAELRKVGVRIEPVYRDGRADGFEVRGRATYEGGAELSSWSDHRNFMSLFLASLRMRRPNRIDGADSVVLSFPGFFGELEQLGVDHGFVPASCVAAGDGG